MAEDALDLRCKCRKFVRWQNLQDSPLIRVRLAPILTGEAKMKTVLTVATLLCMGSAGFAQEIGGHYKVNGTNFDGSPYTGEAQITLTSEYTCNIVWKTGGSTSSGICMRNNNAFTAGYELNGKVGLVIYLIKDDGTLDGTWTVDGVNAVGTEVLTRN